MLDPVKRFLYKPHPFIFNWVSIVVPFLVTFLVLLVLRPFEFDQYPLDKLVFTGLIFSAIPSISVVFVLFFLRKMRPRIMNPERWTLGKEVALVFTVLLTIVGVIFLLFFLRFETASPFLLLWKITTKTLLIGFFPVIVLVLTEQYLHQKKKHKEAEQLNRDLLQKVQGNPPYSSVSKLALTGENGKLALQLDPADLLLIAAQGNYLDVYHRNQDGTTKTLVRNSLKAVESQLPKDFFFRCHKSYIVRLDAIQHIEGNARSLEIIFDHFDERVPVSRAKSAALHELFSKRA